MRQGPARYIASFLKLIGSPETLERDKAAQEQAAHADPDDPSENEAGAGENIQLLLALEVFDGDGQDQLEEKCAADDERGADDVHPAGKRIDDVVEPVGHGLF